MSQRKKFDARCDRCLMRRELCLCPLIPRLDLATRVVLIISKRELRVPTNTGRLATLALSNSTILRHGDQEHSYDVRDHLMPGAVSLLLYPAPDAIVLSPEFARSLNGPCNLIVPDGNWRQTIKMRRRDPYLATLPVVTLPPGAASGYRVRRESKAAGLATIEAIARALGYLEGLHAQMALEELFQAMVTRTLASRGTPLHGLPTKAVSAEGDHLGALGV